MRAKMFVGTIALLAILFVTDAMAQRGRRAPDVRQREREDMRTERRAEQPVRGTMEYCQMIPDLTEEQESSIRELRLEQIKRNTHHRNKMDELRVRKRNIMTGTTDGDVDEVIDDITELRNTQMKENVRHREAVRDLLTEDQRVIFDNQTMRRQDRRGGTGRDRGHHEPRQGRGRW